MSEFKDRVIEHFENFYNEHRLKTADADDTFPPQVETTAVSK